MLRPKLEMRMTPEQARALKSFDEYCQCGGFAHQLNGRDPRRPHMDWCPQREQYNAWYDALHPENNDGKTSST